MDDLHGSKGCPEIQFFDVTLAILFAKVPVQDRAVPLFVSKDLGFGRVNYGWN